MTCNNNEECSMRESGNCTCDFFKKIIQIIPKILIWSLPILLGLIYLIFYLYFKDEKWIKDLSPNAAFVGVFFGGTLTYYGVLYTLTYRVKVEVLSKNRQEWINEIRTLFSKYANGYNTINKVVSYKISKEETDKTFREIYNIFYSVQLYLNQSEELSKDILSVMNIIKERGIQRAFLLDIERSLYKKNPNKLHVLAGNFYADLFNNDMVKAYLLNLEMPTDYRIIIACLLPEWKTDCDELVNTFDQVKKKYSLDKNKYKNFDQEVEAFFIFLTSKCLKQEWERVKKAR